MDFKKIKSITESDLIGLGFNGYRTNKIYKVTKDVVENKQVIEISEEVLNETYVKEWNQNLESVKYFEEIMEQGLSIGCYEGEKLIGFALIGYYAWNKSMWIENIRVSEKFRGRGIGKKLIGKVIEKSSLKGARILGLETQSTNFPAIEFYKKCGFEISGVDFARYPQRENDREQVAILMQIGIEK